MVHRQSATLARLSGSIAHLAGHRKEPRRSTVGAKNPLPETIIDAHSEGGLPRVGTMDRTKLKISDSLSKQNSYKRPFKPRCGCGRYRRHQQAGKNDDLSIAEPIELFVRLIKIEDI